MGTLRNIKRNVGGKLHMKKTRRNMKRKVGGDVHTIAKIITRTSSYPVVGKRVEYNKNDPNKKRFIEQKLLNDYKLSDENVIIWGQDSFGRTLRHPDSLSPYVLVSSKESIQRKHEIYKEELNQFNNALYYLNQCIKANTENKKWAVFVCVGSYNSSSSLQTHIQQQYPREIELLGETHNIVIILIDPEFKNIYEQKKQIYEWFNMTLDEGFNNCANGTKCVRIWKRNPAIFNSKVTINYNKQVKELSTPKYNYYVMTVATSTHTDIFLADAGHKLTKKSLLHNPEITWFDKRHYPENNYDTGFSIQDAIEKMTYGTEIDELLFTAHTITGGAKIKLEFKDGDIKEIEI